MKRWRSCLWTALLLCLLSALMAVPVFGAKVVESGPCGDDLTYTLYSDGLLTISGTGAMWDYEGTSDGDERYSTAPWGSATVKALRVETGVTTIGDCAFAFYSGDDLTKMALPVGLTSIGSCAFYSCDNLSSVTLPDGLTSIGDEAFSGCYSLTSVTFPEGLTSIGDAAFRGCNDLTSVTLPEGLTSIGAGAFRACDSLTSVTLPEGLTSIGGAAFLECHSLSSVNIPKSVSSIGPGSFASCSALRGIWVDPQNEHYTSDDNGILFDKAMTTLIQAHRGITGNYTAPEGLTSIGYSAFEDCDSLTSVVLPEGLTSIGDAAFRRCNDLTSVTLPEGLTSIGGSAFSSCYDLTSVTFPEGLTSIGSYAFCNCDSLSSVTFPEGLTSIGAGAFYGCDSLGSMILPEGLTSIGDEAFYNCGGLTSVTFPDGLTSIGGSAFEDCDSLTSVTLQKGLTSIGTYAFAYCNRLASVTLPEGLTDIEGDAFSDCRNLDQVIFLGDAPVIASDTFYNVSATVYYPTGNETWTKSVKKNYGGTLVYKELGSPSLQVQLTDPYYLVGEAVEKDHLNVSMLFDSGAEIVLDPTQFTMTGADTTTPGAKVLTVSSQGYQAELRVGVHRGERLETDSADWPESSHNYSNDTNETKVLTIPGANRIRIIFSEKTYVENGFDYLYVYDSNDEQMARFTGNEADGKTVSITGDTVKIRLVSDDSNSGWGYSLSDVDAAWLEHDYETEGGPCTICSLTIDHTHIWSAADCVSPEVCTVCGTTRGDALGHDWQAATCTTPETCVRCGDVTGEALGHDWQAATCTTPETCTRCGATTGEALGHNWQAATCAKPQYCTTCGATSGMALGHSYQVVRNEPTCTTAGSEVSTCARCGVQTTTTLPATGHDWEDATCTSPRKCTGCGITSGDPLNHTWNAATCTDPRTCAYCGATSGEPMGHSWRPADCLNPSSCVYCDATQGEALGHNYKVTTGICTRCGDIAPFQVDPPQMVSCYSKDYTYIRSTWTKVEGVDGYELYRSTDPNDLDSFVVVKSILDPEVTSYSNRLTTQGVTYYYRVCSFVFLEDGLTRVRSKLSEPMHMPSKVFWNEPYSNSDFRVRLRWNEVSGCHGYQIWIREEGGQYRVVKTIGDKGNTLTKDQGGVTAYSNVGLKAGQKYTYKMRAFYIDENGTKTYGPYSDEVTVAVQPSAPVVTVKSYSAGQAKVMWELSCAADGHQIWMSEKPDSGFKIVKSVTDGSATSYTKNGLQSGKTYYFKVRSYTEVNGKKSFGAYSETIMVTIK